MPQFAGASMSLLDEIKRMADVEMVPMQGGGKAQPWTMPIYGYGAELEMMEFLYAFVRLTKPSIVFEAGCHLGMAAWAMGKACQDNGFGCVWTCDIEEEYTDKTRERCRHLPVSVSLLSAEKMREVETCDFAFLDSSYETRMQCLELMKPGSTAIMHDSRQEMSLREHKHPALHFDTWRGFSIVRK